MNKPTTQELNEQINKLKVVYDKFKNDVAVISAQLDALEKQAEDQAKTKV